MQRQASSNISSHSWGLSIRTVTLKVILLLAPPPPAAGVGAASAAGLDPPEPRWPPPPPSPPPSAATAATATADRRAEDRLTFLEEERAAVLGEPQVGDAAPEAAPHAAGPVFVLAGRGPGRAGGDPGHPFAVILDRVDRRRPAAAAAAESAGPPPPAPPSEPTKINVLPSLPGM